MRMSPNSNVYYVAKNGSDSNNGSINSPWLTINKAVSTISAGSKVYIREGIYEGYITLVAKGTESQPITIAAYPGESPVIDGSGKAADPSNAWAVEYLLFYIYGDYIAVKDLEFQNSASRGVFMIANHVTLDNLYVHNCYLSGISFYKSYYGTVKNCMLHDFYDYGNDGTGGGGNADALHSTSGNGTIPYEEASGYHTFENNVIFNASDDGIDTWTSVNNTIKNNIVSHTGYSNVSNGGSKSVGELVGDGNGYKLGKNGYNTVMNNIAFDTGTSGFVSNSGVNLTLYNNTAYNCSHYGFLMWDSGLVMKNNISYKSNYYQPPFDAVDEYNSWNLNIDNPQFVSTSPDNPNFLRLTSGSPAVDAGVDVGFPYKGSAPDLGAYEFDYNTLPDKSDDIFLLSHLISGPTKAVAVDGDYLYYGKGAYVEIADISDPAHPLKVGRVILQGVARDITVSGDYAYIAEGTNGLRIIDISKKFSPFEIGAVDTKGWAYSVSVNGDYAYVADGNDGLRIVDISKKAIPVEVGFVDTEGYAAGVSVSGNSVYVADLWNGLVIVDVSSKEYPKEIGHFNTVDYVHNVTVDSNYAYLANGESGLRIVDVSSPFAPAEVGDFNTDGAARDVVISGEYAIIADWQDGMRIIDVSNSDNPKEVGYFNTQKNAQSVTVNGEYIFVADGFDGVYILQNEKINRIDDKLMNVIPGKIDLFQNYPNPFNPTTSIRFIVPLTGNVKLEIYNTLGQLVDVLIDKELKSGEYALKFNGGNLTSGLYFYKLQSNGQVEIKKMVLLK